METVLALAERRGFPIAFARELVRLTLDLYGVTILGVGSIYIYSRVKTWSKIAFFESKIGPSFLFFFFPFFVFVFKNLLLSAGWMRFFKTSGKKTTRTTHFLSQNLVQLCCATYLDQVLTQPWTKFWLNLFDIFWPLFPFSTYAQTTIFIEFSAKICIFKPTLKKLGTLLVNTIALADFLSVFFSFFVFFWFLLCPVFGGSFLRGMKKNKFKTKQQKTKKEEGPQDANKKTT